MFLNDRNYWNLAVIYIESYVLSKMIYPILSVKNFLSYWIVLILKYQRFTDSGTLQLPLIPYKNPAVSLS